MHFCYRKRAEVIEEFFNAIMRDNAGRAIHEQCPLVYEQVRTKWLRTLENHTASTEEVEPAATSGGLRTSQAPAATNAGKARGGTSVRGRGGRGARGGAPTGRITTRTTYQGPVATLNGIRSCYGYNDDQRPCTRQMKNATTCTDATGRDLFVHCCSFYDPVIKKHCLSLNHARFNGGH